MPKIRLSIPEVVKEHEEKKETPDFPGQTRIFGILDRNLDKIWSPDCTINIQVRRNDTIEQVKKALAAYGKIPRDFEIKAEIALDMENVSPALNQDGNGYTRVHDHDVEGIIKRAQAGTDFTVRPGDRLAFTEKGRSVEELVYESLRGQKPYVCLSDFTDLPPIDRNSIRWRVKHAFNEIKQGMPANLADAIFLQKKYELTVAYDEREESQLKNFPLERFAEGDIIVIVYLEKRIDGSYYIRGVANAVKITKKNDDPDAPTILLGTNACLNSKNEEGVVNFVVREVTEKNGKLFGNKTGNKKILFLRRVINNPQPVWQLDTSYKDPQALDMDHIEIPKDPTELLQYLFLKVTPKQTPGPSHPYR